MRALEDTKNGIDYVRLTDDVQTELNQKYFAHNILENPPILP